MSSVLWLLPIATAVGAWGGFPEAPKFWKDLTERSELFRYFTVFILVWQGGGGQNARVSLAITVLLYIIATFSKWKEIVEQNKSSKEQFWY
jgi:hypothetical protein